MKFSRALTLGNINEETRTVEASMSSELPVYRPGVGDEVLVHTSASVDLSRAPLPLITSHDQKSTPIGIVEGLTVTGGKLRGTLRFGTSLRATELWNDVVDGIVRNLSVGYQILDFVQEAGGIRATSWQPFEVSIVAVPADSTVGIGRSFTKDNTMSTNTGTNNTQPSNTQTRSQRRAAARTDQREDDIENVFRSHPELETLRDKCLDDPLCDLNKARELILVALAKRSDKIVTRGGGSDFYLQDNQRSQNFVEACQQSLQIRSGLRVANPLAEVRNVERMDLCTMAENILTMQGKNTRGLDRSSLFRAALGTSDFPLLLANTAGKSLQLGYQNEATTHQVWTGEREVQNFKPQSLVKLSEAPGLLEVQQNGEYQQGNFGEAAETFSVKTYGRIFSITRQAMINDDLGALTNLPAAFGASARRIEADQVYAKLTANAALSDGIALFHANHGNLAATGAALSVTSLGAARAAMRKQKGVAGTSYIDPQPRFLIVPVGLETLGESILNSTAMYGATNNTDNLSWIRNLTLVADPRLDAASATAWYLAASPAQIDHIIRAYLAGQGRPFVEQEVVFGTDALNIKARLDLGVGVIDYRGLYRNPGA